MRDGLNKAYHAATKAVIAENKQRAVNNWIGLMLNGLSQPAIQAFTNATGPTAIATQMSVANLTSSFLSQRTGKPPIAPVPGNVLSRNGTPQTPADALPLWGKQYARPFIEARQLVKEGMPLDEAVLKTAQRVEKMLDTDAQMSKLRQAHQSLAHYGSKRYKRVLHPEDSASGPCPLCILASTQVYYVEDLMPIHVGCQCDVDEIQPGDITRINGRNYVGLGDLQIPEHLMTTGPRADPNSDRSKLAYYLQQLDKRQYEASLKAWADHVIVEQHDEIGPVMAYKKSQVLTYQPGLEQTLVPKKADEVPQDVLGRVAWTGPDVSQPIALTDLADEDPDLLDKINSNIDSKWGSVEFDEYKYDWRAGARDAQRNGYEGMAPEDIRAFELETGVYNEDEIFGKELVARAVWSDPTEYETYRGMQLSPEDWDKLASWEGKEISMPLSSFADDQVSADIFATGKGHWTSSSVPGTPEGMEPPRPVVLTLEPGAKMADIGPYYDDQPTERVGFGRFIITSVDKPDDPTDYPLGITIRQTSMIEAQTAEKAVEGATTGIPDLTFVGENRAIPIVPPANEPYAPILFSDTAEEAITKFETRWPTVELTDGTRIASLVMKDETSQRMIVETLKGVDEVLDKFPEVAVHLDQAGIGDTPPWALGATQAGRMRGDIASTIMSVHEVAQPEVLTDAVEQSVLSGFYHQNSELYPAHSTMIHEMGHVLDFYTDMAASDEVPRVLKETFIETLPIDVQEQASTALRLWDTGIDFTEMTREEQAIYDTASKWDNDYREWLSKELSGGSYDPFRVNPDPYEVVAEAFQDVWLNGRDASQADQAIYDLLMRKVEGTTRVYRELGGAA